MQISETLAVIEAILFVAGDPVNVAELAHHMNLTMNEMDDVLSQLARSFIETNRGVRLNRNGGEAYLSIDPVRAQAVEKFLQPMKKQALSQAVMETLSVIAYRQPATRAEIEAVRGVKCDYSVQMLLKRGLIEEAGQRDTLGRPTEYRTTDKFLMHFGIESIDQLPDINAIKPDVPELPASSGHMAGVKGPFEE